MKNRSVTNSIFALVAILLQPSMADSAESETSHVAVDNIAVFGEGASEPVSPTEWYGAGVRPTEKRSAEEERLGFHLPPGFDIQLIAAEPEIAKPLNMAFDFKGKLWITQTIEYPYPRTDGKLAGDCVKTLEDTDGDGTFDRITTFADGLNIPIGLLPYEDGVIVFSIPNLIHLRDTDGDGRCDQRNVILGPFDTSMDTHGMVNSLRRGDDGWIYACHGFNNRSVVKGSDGHVVSMTSGNTFRFRPDGSRVELFTSGQVNPFGMTVDRWGNRYTADCHSKPITMLVRGACNPSFGRPDDGLGFFPSMMDHSHGSTAISGLSFYDANQFPAEYRDQLYSGNVMTSRINRDRIQQTGATAIAQEVTDFMTSDDPWFRPVDIQLGPDGALYVADFYNRIIGHYEVPLDHPGRDRESGRIWKIRYRSSEPRLSATPIGDASNVQSCFEQLADANATRRQLALDALTSFAATQPTQVLSLARDRLKHGNNLMRIGAMWLLHRDESLSTEAMSELIQDSDAIVRHHALRALAERNSELEVDARTSLLPLVRSRLSDSDPSVVGSAAQAIAIHGDSADAARLVTRIMSSSATDPMLTARLRIALRDLITRKPECLESLSDDQNSRQANTIYCDVLLGIHSPFAAAFIIDELGRNEPGQNDLAQNELSQPSTLAWIQFAARHSNENDLDRLVAILRKQHSASPSEGRKMLSQLKDSIANRSTPEVIQWAESIVGESLRQVRASAHSDILPIDWRAEPGASWTTEKRKATDAEDDHQYQSSLSLGEKYTGVLRSGEFIAPGEVLFWLVGHNGHPNEIDSRLNRIHLVDVASDKSIKEACPPRSDIATKVVWDLTEYAGRLIRLELIDGDAGDAYAWIAVGRFSVEQLNPAGLNDEWTSTLDLISQYRLTSQALPLSELACDPLLDVNRRLQAAERFGELRDDPVTRITAWFLSRFPHDPVLNARFFALLNDSLPERVQESAELYRSIIRDGARTLTQANQRELARRFAASRELAPWLLESMDEGWLSPSLLHDKAIDTSLESTLTETFAARLASLKLLAAKESNDLVELRESILSQSLKEPGDLNRGTAIFQKHCATCHQLGGQGSLVGPQLDGIGARGSERLLEDILLPDRNVDKAFRTTSLLLDSGLVRVGLIRSETESTIELIENNGQVSQVDAASVTSRRASDRSLMPDGHSETIGVPGLVDLLQYMKLAAAPKKAP